MSLPSGIVYQPSLFSSAKPAFDPTYAGVQRIELDDACWLDHGPGFLRGADALFEHLLDTRRWAQRSRWMYKQKLPEPRLTDHWDLDTGELLQPPILEELRQSLSAHYDVLFDSVGFNLYRDGRDSVAWHGDKISKDIEEPIVVLVSLGSPRTFLLRPKGGGRSRRYLLGGGDLLVTGGRTQRDWEHSVPKVARAGPRISIAYRHDLDPRAYPT